MAPPDRRALVRARVSVALLFGLYGTLLGAWTARIPAIKSAAGLSDGQLSVGLLAFAAGAITGMQLAGRLVDRYRSGRVVIPAAFADAAALTLPGLATGLPTVVAALYIFGTVHGVLNVSMNVRAVELQHAYRRPIVSSLHAVYSAGGFLGAAVGGLLAHGGAGAAATFAAVGAAGIAVTVWAARWAMPAQTSAADSASPADRAGGTHGISLLGVLVFCCLVGEGAAADWSAVYLRDSLGTTAGFAAAAYAAFSVMMMAGRLVGDRLAAAVGPVWLVRGSGVLAAVGLGAALLIGEPIAAVVGFGLLGAGLSGIAPQVFSAAGSRDPERAGHAIARVASLGFLGFVVGPVVIGALAELVGLPAALAVPVVLALFVAGTASVLGRR